MAKGLPSTVAMASLFVVANAAALLLAAPAQAFGYQALPNPEDPFNPVWYIVLVLVFTGIILLAIKMKRDSFLKYVILGSMAITMVYVYSLPLTYLFIGLQDPALFDFASLTPAEVDLLGTLNWIAFGVAVLLAALLTYLLVKRPEWYVVDTVGVSIAAGVIAIMGISFGILPAFILLIALAVYDAWAVYHTKHMVALADAVTEQRLPVLLVIPKHRGYSFLKQKRLTAQLAAGEEREAMFMGLGDIIIPGILAVSAFTFLPYATLAGVPKGLLVAVASLAGALVGYAVLMRYVAKGKPQAGLPLLNGGAIAGYAVAYLVLFGNGSLGLLR